MDYPPFAPSPELGILGQVHVHHPLGWDGTSTTEDVQRRNMMQRDGDKVVAPWNPTAKCQEVVVWHSMLSKRPKLDVPCIVIRHHETALDLAHLYQQPGGGHKWKVLTDKGWRSFGLFEVRVWAEAPRGPGVDSI